MISPHVPAGQTVFVYLLQHIDTYLYCRANKRQKVLLSSF